MFVEAVTFRVNFVEKVKAEQIGRQGGRGYG